MNRFKKYQKYPEQKNKVFRHKTVLGSVHFDIQRECENY